MSNISKLTKEEYNNLKSAGMLWEYYPEASGSYEADVEDRSTLTQPTPKGSGFDIATLVQKDIEARAKKGMQTYGERLKANNGRDAMIDLYQELLDACMYIRQIMEEDGNR